MFENQVFNEDCIDTLKKMKKNNIKVDLIIADPPYNVSRKHQLGFSNMGRSGMDYGEWDYSFDQKKWLRYIKNIVKPGGSVIVFNDWKNLALIAETLDKQGFNVKDILRWEKSNPMPRNVSRRYVNDCEYAVWAVMPGKKWKFNKDSDVAYLRPKFTTSVVAGKNRIHPTQKSESLIEDLVKIHSCEGDIIYDPFMGSGTTAMACINLNRTYIGSEIDPKMHKKSLKRINRGK